MIMVWVVIILVLIDENHYIVDLVYQQQISICEVIADQEWIRLLKD